MTHAHTHANCRECQQRELVENLRDTPLWHSLTRPKDETFNEVDLALQEDES